MCLHYARPTTKYLTLVNDDVFVIDNVLVLCVYVKLILPVTEVSYLKHIWL